MERKIIRIIFNWFYTQENGEEYSVYEVGIEGVISIKEHICYVEGDKWFYDVELENGLVRRIFNVNEVTYEN